MVFTKSFPREIEGSSYPRWIEIKLTEFEEREQEEKCRLRNIEIMKECLEDSKRLILDVDGVSEHQADIVDIARTLFEKRAGHEIYWKEEKAKEKFELTNLK